MIGLKLLLAVLRLHLKMKWGHTVFESVGGEREVDLSDGPRGRLGAVVLDPGLFCGRGFTS